MLRRCLPSVGLAICAVAWVGACRDWDRFEPVAAGGGAPATTTSSSSSAGPGGTTSGSSGGGGAGGSGVGGGGGEAPLECGKIDILNDDFESPSWDWRWEIGGQEAVFTREAGDLVVNLGPGDNGHQLDSTGGFDFRGRTMVIEMAQPVPPGVVFWFDVAGDHDNYLELGVGSGGELYYGYELNGSFFTFAADALSPSEYRFWRFREDNGTVYFDISNDGSSWMERQSFDASDLFDPLYTQVYAGAWKPDTGVAEQVHIARVYSDVPGQSKPCPIEMLTDDFADGERGANWSRGWDDPVCPWDESTGVLRASCGPMAYTYSAYGSSSLYDLTGSSITAEVVEPAASGSSAWFALRVDRPDAQSLWSFEVNDGELLLHEAVNGDWNLVEWGAYNPDAGRFLRIREEAGQVYFEQSPDGVSYTEFDQRTPPFDVSQLRVYLLGGANDNTDFVSVGVDNLNLGP